MRVTVTEICQNLLLVGKIGQYAEMPASLTREPSDALLALCFNKARVVSIIESPTNAFVK